MLPFNLAVRFLKAGRGQTVLIIIGIGIAVAAQIFVGLLINSLQLTLVDRTVGNQPQVTISSATDTVTIDDTELVTLAGQEDGVATVAVSASGNGFVSQGTRTAPVLVRGFGNEADMIYGVNDTVFEGRLPENGDEVLIGKDLQEEFDFLPGDDLVITTPAGSSGTYAIAGVYDLGVSQINKTWIITGIGTAQELFGYGDAVTEIEITVNDYFEADIIAGRIKAKIESDDLAVSNWKSDNEQLLSGLQGQSISSLMIQIFIIVSVVIAISAILAITVFQKSRQLGILKAMGIKDVTASLIFIYEGLIIGLIGSMIGVLLGLGLLYGFSAGTSQPGTEALIDLYIDIKFILLSWGIAVIASVLAALIPARRSLRLNPIDVIREG